MSIAARIGTRLRSAFAQRPLTDQERQVWTSLQLIEGLPDYGWEQVESSPFSKMWTFEIAVELFIARYTGLRVSPTVSAWIASHAQGRVSYVTMWAAIVASIIEADKEPHAGRRVFLMQDLAAAMKHRIPTDEHFDQAWVGCKLVNGKNELDMERSWT